MKGYETFYQTIKPLLKDPSDLIVSVIHWILIQDFDFKCIAVDNQLKAEYRNIPGSELLPNGWNNNRNHYNLLYRSAILETENILLNCVADENDADKIKVLISDVTADSQNEKHRFLISKKTFVNPDDHQVFETFGNEKVNRLATFIRQNIPNLNCPKKSIVPPTTSSSSENPSSHDDPSNLAFSKFIPTPAQPRSLLEDDPNRLINPPIGRGDLDPFGHGIGGGMIFDPFSGNRLRPERGPPMNWPRGAVPPGARYDPIGPTPDARFFRPDPDHLPPPHGPSFDGHFM
ncbi:proteasome inhibitor 31 kDa [Dermatophagoides pteronyssinus]|uniref:proteasome inhibitor 31 kDa n=1 Tax=Dermatophagoides pteronyssinus TaxID=6956 RepID=UPI003F66861C